MHNSRKEICYLLNGNNFVCLHAILIYFKLNKSMTLIAVVCTKLRWKISFCKSLENCMTEMANKMWKKKRLDLTSWQEKKVWICWRLQLVVVCQDTFALQFRIHFSCFNFNSSYKLFLHCKVILNGSCLKNVFLLLSFAKDRVWKTFFFCYP